MKRIIMFLLILFLAVTFQITINTKEVYAENTFYYYYKNGFANYDEWYWKTKWNISSYENKATAKINTMTFTQNDSQYILTYDIDYTCTDLTYDSTKTIGNYWTLQAGESSSQKKYTYYYESTNSGNLVLSDQAISNITFSGYEYDYGKTGLKATWNYNYTVNSSDNKYSKYADRRKDGVYNTTTESANLDLYAINLPSYSDFNGTTISLGSHKDFASSTNVLSGIKQTGASISQSVTNIGDGYWAYKFKGTITIEKSSAANFKYLTLLSPCAKKTSYSREVYSDNYDNITSKFVGLYADAIDVSTYTSCSHNWQKTYSGDKSYHTSYCTKCKWEKSEAHSYDYEYDGIKNDLCACGYIKKCNYTFILNDNTQTTITKQYDTYSDYTAYEKGTKTGYIFQNYEKYEKRFQNMTSPTMSATSTPITSVLVGTCTSQASQTEKFSTIYKAVYNPITYTIKYNNSNNKNLTLSSSISDQTFKYDTAQNLKTGITVKGYTNLGWSNTAKGETVTYQNGQSVKNLTTTNATVFNLYPVYKANTFTINYDNENNVNKTLSGTISAQEITYDVSQKLKDNIPLTGYTFKGWTKTKNGTNVDYAINAEASNMLESDGDSITIYPIYNANKFTINYKNDNNVNKTLDGSISSQDVTYDVSQKLNNNIDITGYTFKGWSKTKCGTNVDYEINAEACNMLENDGDSIDLYPVYKANKFTVNYNNDNNVNKTLNGSISAQEITYDASQKLKDNIPLTGYTFMGWSKTKSGENVDYAINAEACNMLENDGDSIDLYPVYKANKFTINYKNDNNVNKTLDGSISSQDVTYDVSQKLNNNIPITGYTFKGWSKTKCGENVDYAINEEACNLLENDGDSIDLYPVYKANKFKINYKKDNNVNKTLLGIILSQEVTYDASQKLKDNISLKGYTFMGWSKTKCGESVDYAINAEACNLLENDGDSIDLYPVYKANTYTIKYSNINNVNKTLTASISDQLFTYDESQKLKSNIEVTDYVFEGWTTEEKGQSVEYSSNQEILNLFDKTGSVLTLYPVYKVFNYTILYKTTEGRYDNNKTSISKTYIMTEDKSFEMPHDYRGGNDTYFTYYLDQYGNKFTTMNGLKEYMRNERVSYNDIKLVANFDHPAVGRAESGAGGDDPSKGSNGLNDYTDGSDTNSDGSNNGNNSGSNTGNDDMQGSDMLDNNTQNGDMQNSDMQNGEGNNTGNNTDKNAKTGNTNNKNKYSNIFGFYRNGEYIGNNGSINGFLSLWERIVHAFVGTQNRFNMALHKDGENIGKGDNNIDNIKTNANKNSKSAKNLNEGWRYILSLIAKGIFSTCGLLVIVSAVWFVLYKIFFIFIYKRKEEKEAKRAKETKEAKEKKEKKDKKKKKNK